LTQPLQNEGIINLEYSSLDMYVGFIMLGRLKYDVGRRADNPVL